jgi:hypothetical protein
MKRLKDRLEAILSYATEILTPSERAGGKGKKIRIQSMEMKFLRSIIGNARRDKLQE